MFVQRGVREDAFYSLRYRQLRKRPSVGVTGTIFAFGTSNGCFSRNLEVLVNKTFRNMSTWAYRYRRV